jgi:hypothetical protein
VVAPPLVLAFGQGTRSLTAVETLAVMDAFAVVGVVGRARGIDVQPARSQDTPDLVSSNRDILDG